MTKAEMQSQIDTLTGRARAAEARVAELESKHPEWMKRIQRERQEERDRIIEILVNRKWEHTPSAYWGDKVSIETDIRRALSIIDSSQQ